MFISEEIKNIKEVNFDQTKYEKSQEYIAEKTSLSIIFETIQLFIQLTFIHFNFYSSIWNYSEPKFSTTFSLLIFVLVSNLVGTLLEIPKDYYSNFIIEEKYGFNKMTKKLFWDDMVKNFIISNILSFILAIIINSTIEYFREKFIVYTMIVLIIALISFLLLYPTVIMPLFNKFENLDLENEKEK